MTLIETSQLLGNFGEFFGAIAVVVTLGYLVLQVRQNTKALKSNIYSTWVGNNANTHMMLADNAELFGAVYSDARHWRDLNPTEKQAHFALWHHTVNCYESIYLNYLEGSIDGRTFDAKHRNMVWYFGNHPLQKETWRFLSEHVFDFRFVDYVNTKVLPQVE